jgi:hypothetical protein
LRKSTSVSAVPVRVEREILEEKKLTQRAQRRRRGHGDTEDMVRNGDGVEDEILGGPIGIGALRVTRLF